MREDDEADRVDGLDELVAHNAARRLPRAGPVRTALAALVILALLAALVTGIAALTRNHDEETAPPPRPTNAALTVTATRANAAVLVRAGDEHGRVLFRGTVKVGQTVTVHAQRFWLRLADAHRVALYVDGRRLLPAAGQGPFEAVVTSDGIVG